VTVIVALVTLWFQLKDPVYRGGVYAVAVWYVLGLLYFAFFGRHHLILSPEEEFALSYKERASGELPPAEKAHT
jgi:ethanolamine permease